MNLMYLNRFYLLIMHLKKEALKEDLINYKQIVHLIHTFQINHLTQIEFLKNLNKKIKIFFSSKKSIVLAKVNFLESSVAGPSGGQCFMKINKGLLDDRLGKILFHI